ncbi:DegT/DnrJ/EryC1/StrS aminotransferase family protein [Candidatus Roizmanbacteria bacterium]|nr:DegT/DnrJ/EryC1/StrS aminotransferase family protein [Candidatus Roizmanbacteria bacterium]
MISTDFAPNEFQDDAMASLITLFSIWKWKRGNELNLVKKRIESYFLGAKSIFFLSGRSALSILLAELKLPQNSEVVVQGFTCEAVVLPIIHNKLKPVYADIEGETYSFDLSDLERKITDNTRVLILQHTFGMVPKYRDRVLQLAIQKKLFVIEDLAHGCNPAFWQTQNLSDNQVLTLSFGRSKALSSVFGGALITSNKSLTHKLEQAEACLPYPSYSMMFKLLCYKPLAVLIKSTYNYLFLGKVIHKIITILGLMTAEISKQEKSGEYDPYLEKKYPNFLAKLLLIQLNKFEITLSQRTNICSQYAFKFQISNFKLPLSRFPLLVKNKTEILYKLANRNIFLGSWYSQPIAPKELRLDRVGYTMGSCPEAERINKEIINLPTLISIQDAQKITQAIS